MDEANALPHHIVGYDTEQNVSLILPCDIQLVHAQDQRQPQPQPQPQRQPQDQDPRLDIHLAPDSKLSWSDPSTGVSSVMMRHNVLYIEGKFSEDAVRAATHNGGHALPRSHLAPHFGSCVDDLAGYVDGLVSEGMLERSALSSKLRARMELVRLRASQQRQPHAPTAAAPAADSTASVSEATTSAEEGSGSDHPPAAGGGTGAGTGTGATVHRPLSLDIEMARRAAGIPGMGVVRSGPGSSSGTPDRISPMALLATPGLDDVVVGDVGLSASSRFGIPRSVSENALASRALSSAPGSPASFTAQMQAMQAMVALSPLVPKTATTGRAAGGRASGTVTPFKPGARSRAGSRAGSRTGSRAGSPHSTPTLISPRGFSIPKRTLFQDANGALAFPGTAIATAVAAAAAPFPAMPFPEDPGLVPDDDDDDDDDDDNSLDSIA